MALNYAPLPGLLSQLRGINLTDRVRAISELAYQELIDAGVAALVGARPFEHTIDCTTYRKGSRLRLLTGHRGDLKLRIPKLRQWSFVPTYWTVTEASIKQSTLR